MPQKDGTGPNKQGPKTGRGQGDCKPKVNPNGRPNTKPGKGFDCKGNR